MIQPDPISNDTEEPYAGASLQGGWKAVQRRGFEVRTWLQLEEEDSQNEETSQNEEKNM